MGQDQKPASETPQVNPAAEEKVCGNCKRVFRTDLDFMANTSRWRICENRNLWFLCSCGNTLVLSKGKYSWYDPRNSMSKEAASVFDKLLSKTEMPYMSTAVMEFLEALKTPEITPQKLASCIRKEPTLAAEVLGIANNLKTPTGEKIHSLEHAIVYVGIKTVTELTLVAAAKMVQFKTQEYTVEQHWKESFLTGVIAEELAMKLGMTENLDEAYLAGVLANIGKVVGAVCLPGMVDKVYNECRKKTFPPLTWLQAEKKTSQIDHRVLGEIAAVLWGLPIFVIKTARQHHDLPMFGGTKVRLSYDEIAAFANQIMHVLLDQTTSIEESLLKGYSIRLFSTTKEFDAFVEKIRTSHPQFIN